ncbi:pre-mRNA-processing factor 39 [Pyricularia oryzae 70-15]|uniref:Pre-mRNA-processing factor 39 n=4 Tax=Pyricularia oryzae TaxID=318829 RepID=G4MRU5_PYRO7|nr:pre-mRNA-processing factor 39 [Pyricularia oryzae 70-15]EHA58311.1 pre-mRNA-processing factor 39 [Pyricularia oryzae 70-15]ELQ32999.1 pre-mRNA-processing factor 39 [Pyricularia oryzae Y34]KAI7927977.1 pre-mRNA-processing factor 39 [Pyricularia oryzae]KAI7928568.1 pre-mRNA-processing factor 39 [Pyricularia oryzae]
MADFNHFGGSDEENAEIKRLRAEVDADPDSFENWEKLVRACEALDGGLTRNSSPQALATLRDAYDRFLLKFPLLFGYWKKYADLEFTIAGPESAEMVYERGCASITNSVDLWTEYCSFKMETTHVPQLVRDLFERGAACVGLDFMAHPFWNKYLEYEERQEAHENIFKILQRVIHIPMYQYARYYERFSTMVHTRALDDVVSAELQARFKTEIEAEAAAYGVTKTEPEFEQEMRRKVDAHYGEIFTKTQTEVTKRWLYEAEIKRPYFHVTELEKKELSNWRKYLDFEEAEGSFVRTAFLYERCLVTCAFYDEFWFRYARWMSAQPDKTEEVRNIYLRAATIFVPISRPGIRLQFAYFEESCGRVAMAREVHNAILLRLPGCIEVIISLANLERRHNDIDTAIEVLKQQIESPEVDIWTKAVLVTEWASLLWTVKGTAEEARAVFQKNAQWYGGSRHFWMQWIQFELEQPTSAELEAQHSERLREIIDKIRTESNMSSAAKKELCGVYLAYLQHRGGKDAMKQFLAIDREMYGPTSISLAGKAGKENGAAAPEVDEATRLKAEARHYSFYQLHAEPGHEEQGTAMFN